MKTAIAVTVVLLIVIAGAPLFFVPEITLPERPERELWRLQ